MSQQARKTKITDTIIDSDVHIGLNLEELTKRLPEKYAEQGLTGTGGGASPPGGRSTDNDYGKGWSSSERSPEVAKEHLLDEYDIDVGIITGSTYVFGVAAHQNRHYALAMARAHSEWVDEVWLSSDDRFRGSVVVAPQHPEKSADLIREYGSRDDFVQVMMGFKSKDAYGKPEFWPIYEAAEEVGIPVGIHPGGWGGNAPPASTAGIPSNYFEAHNILPQAYMGQVNSLVMEGVFEEFPDLTFVCTEGGFGWVPHLLWRMDENWEKLPDQAPRLEKPPSEYVREHVRFTTQPIEEPEEPEHLLQLFEMMHADETLLFSSDFPHWDGDDPRLALPSNTPDDLKRRIMYENARETYDL